MGTKIFANAAPTAGRATVNFAGLWKNDLESMMTLAVDGQKVSGRYASPVSTGGPPVEGDIVGYVDGDLISFVVNWDGPASLTAWTGQLLNDDTDHPSIKTLWHLVMNVADDHEDNGLWKSTFTGADVFTRP